MDCESVGVDEKETGFPPEGVGPRNVFWLSPGRLAPLVAAACSLISRAFSASALMMPQLQNDSKNILVGTTSKQCYSSWPTARQ